MKNSKLASSLALVASTLVFGCGGGADDSAAPAGDSGDTAMDAGHPAHPPPPGPAHDAGADATSGQDASEPPVDAAVALDAPGLVEAATALDAGPPPDAEVLADAGDHGVISSTYPAFPVDVAQVVANGGPTLSAPVVVTITWPSADTNVAIWEDFGDKLGATSYWSAAVGEYAVGAVTSGAANHVALTEPPPATMTADELSSFIAAHVGQPASDAGPAWPAPTLDAKGNSQTIYSVYIPYSMSITDPGSGVSFCTEGAGGYHDNVVVNGIPVSYAVMLQCLSSGPGHPSFTPQDVEETASHEFAEAATDPYPSFDNGNDTAYVGFDRPHFAWDVWQQFQDETGDACEFFKSSFYQETGSFPYWVQRIWSNKGAAEGHNPCAPQIAEPYYSLTLFPSQKQDITLDFSSLFQQPDAGPVDAGSNGLVATKGFRAAVNQSVTFQVGFFSDAPAGPWTISAKLDADLPLQDSSGKPISNGTATVTIDKTDGQNGEKAYVTVTPTQAGGIGFQLLLLTSTSSSETTPHYLPILIANK